ncbi:MAG TPA: Mpo1-like protein [Paraburkholderia sp.]|nr:Mpo1-like protein [Paraburkholderia sp.]
MRNLTEQLTQYAEYHRDARNIATHFVGIPMIVLALAVLLSRPVLGNFGANAAAWPLHGVPLSPAWLLFGATTLYYLVLDVPLGLMMAAISALCLGFGAWLAQQGTAAWLAGGIGLFVVGWIFQFVGHIAWEHRKPAFADDLIGLVIGPLFVLAEALFGLGWRPALRAAIEAKAGATRINPPRGHAARQ